MHAFEYAAPKTVDEAVALLSGNGDQARILAGGSDIIAQLKEGRRRVKVLVDVKTIPEANELSYDPKKGLTLGAGVPCCRIYEEEAIAKAYPALVDSTSLIGSIQIQGRATVGGNLCNASPAAAGLRSSRRISMPASIPKARVRLRRSLLIKQDISRAHCRSM